MKTTTIKVIFALALMTGFWGCSTRAVPPKEPIVSVSILPLQYFVDQLTGNALEVNVMVPQGASHGTYSPSPRQMQLLSDSDIYFRLSSLGYEQEFIHSLKELNSRMKVVELSNGIELIRGMIQHGDHYHEGGIDPHIWMSPKVMMALLPLIKDGIVEVYPDLKEITEKNYLLAMQEIQAIHNQMEELTRELDQKRFLIFHPALTYLARDYGLEQVAIEHDGKEPSPAQLRRLIMDARAQTVPVIFIQQEYDIRNANLVSQETGARVVQINPLAYDWPQSMRHLMETFSQHLR